MLSLRGSEQKRIVIERTDIPFENQSPRLFVDSHETRAYCYRGGLSVYDRSQMKTLYTKIGVGDINFVSPSPSEHLLLVALANNEDLLLILDNNNGQTLFTLTNNGDYGAFGRCGFITDTTFFALNPQGLEIFELCNDKIQPKAKYDKKISMMRQLKVDQTKAVIFIQQDDNTKELLEINMETLETTLCLEWKTDSPYKNMFIDEDASTVFFKDDKMSFQKILKKEGQNAYELGSLVELDEGGFFSSFIQRGNNFYGVLDYENLIIWDAETMQQKYRQYFKETILEMYVTKDNKEILLGSHDGRKLIHLTYKEQDYQGPFQAGPLESIVTAERVTSDQQHLYVTIEGEALFEINLDNNEITDLLKSESIYDIYAHIPNTRKLILTNKDGDNYHFCFYDFDQGTTMIWNIVLESAVLAFQNDVVDNCHVFYFTENKKVKKLTLNQKDDSYQLETLFFFDEYFDVNTVDEFTLQSQDGSLIFITSNTGLYEIKTVSHECQKISSDSYKLIHFGIDNNTLVAQNTKTVTFDKIDLQTQQVISKLNIYNIDFTKRAVKDKLIVKHSQTSSFPISIWNIDTDICEFIIKYEIGNFVPFWLDRKNMFLYEDGNDNTFKSICIETFKDKNNVEHIGLTELQKLLPQTTVEYDIDNSLIKFYDYSEEEVCQLDAKAANWNEIGIVDQLISSDIRQRTKIVEENLDQRLLRPFSEFRQNIFHEISLQPKLIGTTLEQLEDKENLRQYLLFFKAKQKDSALQFAIQNNQFTSVQLLLDGMVKFCTHPLYNYMIDEALLNLIQFGINLEDYFSSNLPIFEITWETYPSLHHDLSYIVKPFNGGSIAAMINAYDQLFGQELSKETENDVLYPITYYVVNLPFTLTDKPEEFIKVLNECGRVSPFEKKVIQIIIDYKWETYTRQFFMKQFYLYLLFAISFSLDIFVIGLNENQATVQSMVFKTACVLPLLYFLIYELKQASKEGWKTYFTSIWNYVDMLLTLSYILTVSLQFTMMQSQEAISKEQQVIVQLAFSFIVVLAFIKLCFFMRIFKGLGFLVSMLKEVVTDLRFFLLFFFIMLFAFAMIFSLLGADQETYEGIGAAGYLFMSFRTALGDFELDKFYSASDSSIPILWALWIVWAIAVFLSSIIFLNFIIAVISESYEKVMQKAVARSYQEKVAMIHEREGQFTDVEFQNALYFPKYLLVRSPLEGNDDEADEWEGFVKDIKNTQKESSQMIKSNIMSLNLSIKKQRTALIGYQAELQKGIEKIEEQITKKEDIMTQKYDQLQQENEQLRVFIERNFDKILNKLNV